MTQASQETAGQPPQKGTLFGIPMSDLGWFASLLIGLAAGFIAFFATTFLGIIGILLYNTATHHSVDLSLSYRWGGLSAGSLVLLAAWSYLGTQWVRRITRKG